MSDSISVIIPLHNKGAWISETLLSLQYQDYSDWEAIVVENNSSDDGPAIAEDFAKKDSRIIVSRAPKSITGPGAARNYGLQHAKNPWIIFLDADDLLCQSHLLDLITVAKANNSMLASSNWAEFSEDSWKWDKAPLTTESLPRYSTIHAAAGSSEDSHHNLVQDSSIAFAPWAIHCCLVSQEAFSSSQPWIEKLDDYPSEDTAFWFRLVINNTVSYTNRATAIYRKETSNFRNDFSNLPLWTEAMKNIHHENVVYLKRLGHRLNQAQAECLMRVWEKLSTDAYDENLLELGKQSAQMASYWLNHCNTDIRRPNILLRKLLGIGTIVRARRHFTKWQGIH